MKKAIKIILWAIAILIAIPVVLIATLPLWLGPIARPVVNAAAPSVTKTDFHIGRLYLNPYTCNFELGGVRIGNPEGFSETNAVTLGYFNIDIDTASLASDVIVIENVEIDDIFFSLVKNDDGKSNMDVLKENILGAKAELEAEAKADWEKCQEEERQAGKSEEELAAEEAEVDQAFNRKLIINRFVFKNVSGKYGVIPIKVPSIELKDIGKDSGGYDLDNLCTAVLKEFWASVLASATDLGGLLGDGTKAATDAVGEGAKAVGDAAEKGAKAVGEQAGKALDAIKGLF